jgi:hypothetical protein
MQSVLQISPEQAKVLPFSEMDRVKDGKRVSQHPLHDTFIGSDAKRVRNEFYSKVSPGALVADIDPAAQPGLEMADNWNDGRPLPRVQRVFTMPFSDLFELWESAAQQRPNNNRDQSRG